jgi:outer membrane protein
MILKMKGSVVTKMICVLMAAGSLAACNQNKSDNKSGASSADASSVNAGSIVYVNQDSLLQKYNYVKDMTARLEVKTKAAESEVGSRRQAIQREAAEYQRNANTMSANDRAAQEQQLNRKGQEFQQYQQNTGAELQNEQAGEQTKLYEKITGFLKNYAKEKGYKLILTYQKGNPTILYGDAGLDITADVVNKLNDEYAKEKK